MDRNLSDILTEVLVFPYDQDIVQSLKNACDSFCDDITLTQFEGTVLHLCLDVPYNELIQSVRTSTGKSFPSRVYRALAGYVAGTAIEGVNDDIDKVLFPLALQNVMKARRKGAEGIIKKCIDPECLVVVKKYWEDNIAIPSLCGKDIVSDIFDKESWSDTEKDIDDCFDDIKSLAQYYCRSEFEKKYAASPRQGNQDDFRLAYEIAKDLTSQNWIFAPENPVRTLKNVGLKGKASSLKTIMTKLRGDNDAADLTIEKVSVFRRFIYSADYQDIGTQRIAPLSFGIAVFYELLYERLKSDYYE